MPQRPDLFQQVHRGRAPLPGQPRAFAELGAGDRAVRHGVEHGPQRVRPRPAGDEEPLQAQVVVMVVQLDRRGLPVASGAPDLLEVRVE
ncbi:hypothetical protein [Pseudonocardia dioxanivorans]|uniref:hypothetical protein n=1 Tax=Pseudonocardia dioxanivorans TaxID=240495 RepID=UPI000CD0146C|nr:hypothetical protein [Pseudonocardia dioxanivorans]